MSAINWPTGADFQKSLQNPSFAFRDDDLKESVMETNKHGMMMMSGRFATVFKANLTNNREYALRVFTTHPGDKTDRYQEIAKHIKSQCLGRNPDDSVFVDFNYFDRGIRNLMDGKWYPLVQMEWVRGKTMFSWITEQCESNNKAKLDTAANNWTKLIKELKAHDIAHGDLQHNNIMFNSVDELKLVDYDGMCVPSLAGQKTLEYGVEPYQHPERNARTKLTTSLDDFSSIFIYVGLYALAQNPNLWNDFVLSSDYEKLLFRKEDLEAPNKSPLFSELKRSAPDVYEMSQRLAQLYNGPIEKVPVLDDFLFSWDPVYTALQKRNFREVDHLASKAGSQKVPADLIQPLDNVKKRLHAFNEAEAALKSKNENKIVAAYNPPLLADWPEANSMLGEIKAATKIPPIHQKLMPVAASGQWASYSSQYLSSSRDILGYAQGVLATELTNKNSVIEKCNQLLGSLEAETQKTEPDFETLRSLESELGKAGPHPEMSPELSKKISMQIKRGSLWNQWFSLSTSNIAEATDTQLVSIWNDDLLGGWRVAEVSRGLLDSAHERLAFVAQLRSAVPKPQGDLASQRVFVQLGGQLPNGYQHSLLKELAAAKTKIESLAAIELELKQSPVHEVKLAKLWAQIKQHAGQYLVDSQVSKRCDLAAARAPLILEIAKLPEPKTARGEFDQGLVRIWNKQLLGECDQVKAYQGAFNEAVARLSFLKQLQEAVNAGKEFEYVRLAKDSIIAKYGESDIDFLIESSPEFSVLRTNAEARHEKIQEIKVSIENGTPERFLELYNEDLLNSYSEYFDPIKEQLHSFISEHVVGSIRLKKPPIGDPVVYMGGGILVRWRWPDSRGAEFLNSCCVGICAGNRAVPETPESSTFLAVQTVERDQYERGQGLNIPLLPNWDKAKLAVWGVVSIGGNNYYTNRLLLGAIDSGKGK